MRYINRRFCRSMATRQIELLIELFINLFVSPILIYCSLKAWKIWYDQYWLLRVEPRHFGRAILHRKAVLVRQVFVTWHWWARSKSCQRIRVDLAIELHMKQLKRWAWNNWISWIFVSRCKDKLNLVAEQWSKINVLRPTFSIWIRMTHEKLDYNEKMVNNN